MAKILIRIICSGWLIFSCLTGISQVPITSGQRTAVVALYHKQIGVREATGHNDGPKVEMYLRSVGLGKGYAWCAAFVRWNFDSCHVHTTINGAAASCYRPGHTVWLNHKWTGDPLPGDVFTLWFKSLNRIGHTGFWDGWANKAEGTVITCEGNTNSGGSRDGDGVYRRIRQQGSIYAVSRWIDEK